MAALKERPILFSGAMVRALLDGSKTQTRRIVKPHPSDDAFALLDHSDGWWPYRSEDGESANVDNMEYPLRCPYGQPGNRLWVRESWKAHSTFDNLPPRDIPESHVWFLADHGYKAQSRTRASMHMPRWASRILLEIVSVRVERLQDIGVEEIEAEGVVTSDADIMRHGCRARVIDFSRLWDGINGAGAWNANPWVWVVEFKRICG